MDQEHTPRTDETILDLAATGIGVVAPDAASVTVEGLGFSSAAPSGSAAICPKADHSGAVCTTPVPGTYRYRLTLRDGSGSVVFTQEAALVVVP